VHEFVFHLPDFCKPVYEELVCKVPTELGPVLLWPHQVNVVAESQVGCLMNAGALRIAHCGEQLVEAVDLVGASAEPVFGFLDEDKRARYVAKLAGEIGVKTYCAGGDLFPMLRMAGNC
jgi:hypothetical protein